MAKVAFFHMNGIMPERGGISRITANLTSLFRSKGIEVWFIGAKKTREYNYDNSQAFLPSPIFNSEQNYTYFSELIRNHKIDTVINQGALSRESHRFMNEIKNRVNFTLISCIHNSILTPIKNYAYQKEYFLKSRHLGYIFNILKTSLANKILIKLYCRKHHALYKTMYNVSDYIVGLSKGMEDELIEITGINSLTKYRTIPNFTNPYDNQIGYNKFEKKRAKTVLWVGSIDIPTKRIDYMLKVWSIVSQSHPDWQLKILGDGPHMDVAKKYAKELHLSNYSFEGRVNPDSYYASAEVLCVTSSHESFSLVLLEALQHGVIPIANNSFHTASEILSNGKYGILSEAFNLTDFSNQLDNLMTSDSLREKFRNQSGSALNQYLPDEIFALWQSII